MPIDPAVALGAEFGAVEFSWTATDVQLYNLALGAGADPVSPRELSYVRDHTPQVLPTFGCVAASFHQIEPPKVSWPGVQIDLAKILHASEQVSVPAPLPPTGSARALSKIVEVWDKGKAAVVVLETSVTTSDGALLWTQRRSIFARGEGGFGGERGPSGAGRQSRRRSGRRTSRSTSRCCRSRRCCTGSAATAIRCIPIPNSPPLQAFRARSCTGYAPTA